MAAGSLAALPEWRGQEGIRHRITVGPACVTISRNDLARAARTAERTAERAHQDASEAGRYHAEYVGERADAEPGAPITGWSRRSRARLFHATGEIDYAPMVTNGEAPVMTTLTYPDQWLRVAPTGAAAKKHLDMYWKRFERAWGPVIALWKMEFQRRGAVHFHLWHPRPDGLAGTDRRAEYETKLAAWKADKDSGKPVGRKPYWRTAVGDGMAYEEWAKATWADIVDHPEPGEKAKHLLHGAQVSEVEEGHVNTPARLAAYFAKHGAFMAKDYQNKVPEAWRAPGAGPGRFWGYKGLSREVRTVDVSPVDADRSARILRRLASRERYWDPTYVNANGDVVGKYRWKKAVREVRVKRARRDHRPGHLGGRMLRSHYPDVISLAGAQYLEPVGTIYRKAMRPVSRFASGSGFLCLDDAPTTLVQLARALDIWREYAPETERQRGSRVAGKVRRAHELPLTAKRARAEKKAAFEELAAIPDAPESAAWKARAEATKDESTAEVLTDALVDKTDGLGDDGEFVARLRAAKAARAEDTAAALARFREREAALEQ